MARSFSFATFFAISFYLGVGTAWVFDRKKGTTCEAAGVFCLDGTRDTLEEMYGLSRIFLSAGSTKRHKVHEGHYTIPETPRTPRTAQLPCPGGYKCIKGERHPCPAGKYGGPKLVARFHEPCAHDCPEGYYCPLASNVGTRYKCGDASVYCPPGSGQPTNVSAAHYTVGGADSATRTNQIECNPGHWCRGGIRYLCSAGRYGSSYGLTTPKCDGPCPVGYWCQKGP